MYQGVWLREATAVAVDSSDRVYCFNRGSHPVLVFDAGGICLNKFGNETPHLGTETIPSVGDTMPSVTRWKGSDFIRPHAITVDHEDNLWLVDDDANSITKCSRNGTRIMMILPEGLILTEAAEMDAMRGKGASPPPRNSNRMFNRPTDVVVHPTTGDLYVTDGYGNNVVHRLRGDGTHVSTWGGPGTAEGQFNCPHSIALHPSLEQLIVRHLALMILFSSAPRRPCSDGGCRLGCLIYS